jgi:hypothetical protein
MIGVGQIVANEKSTAYNDVSLDGAGRACIRACIFRRAPIAALPPRRPAFA